MSDDLAQKSRNVVAVKNKKQHDGRTQYSIVKRPEIMKILLIYPQIDAPLGTNHGIASLAGVLHANGHELDLMHVSEKYRPVPSSEEIIEYINTTGPGLVGF